VTDALGHNQTTVYDNVGNVLSIADGLNNLKTYGYDAKNRRVSTIDAKGGITSTNYDAIGNVTKITDSVGNATSYAYDRLDRMLTETNHSTKDFRAEILSDWHQGRSGNSDELRSRIYFISWSEALSTWLHSLVVLASTKFQCIHQRF
jgi:YD repeat-containing protein